MNGEQLLQRLNAIYPHNRVAIEQIDETGAKVRQNVTERDTRLGNKVSGPAIMELVDVAGFCVCLPQLQADEDGVTIALHIHFLTPCESAQLYAHSVCIKSGKRIMVTEVSVYDSQSRLCAKGSVSYMRIPKAT